MNDIDKLPCDHKYIVGYSARIPPPFFRSLPCDHCGHKIRLSYPRRLIYWLVSMIGFIAAIEASDSIHIKLFGSTFLVRLFVFLLIFGITGIVHRIMLRYAKWLEVEEK